MEKNKDVSEDMNASADDPDVVEVDLDSDVMEVEAGAHCSSKKGTNLIFVILIFVVNPSRKKIKMSNQISLFIFIKCFI